MKRKKISLFLAIAAFPLFFIDVSGQNIVEKTFPCLKLVTDASSISKDKTYALVADDGENMYALKDAAPSSYKMGINEIKDSGDLEDVFFTLKAIGKKYVVVGQSTGCSYGLKDSGGDKLCKDGSTYFVVCAASDYYNGALLLSNNGADRFLATNEGKTLFGMYTTYYNRTSDATTPSKYLPALLYEYDTSIGVISIKTSEGYGTYYTDKEYVMPEGVGGYAVTGTEKETLALTLAYESGETVPANTALIVRGTVGEYKIYAPEGTASSARRNKVARAANETAKYLYGTLEDIITPKPDDSKDYNFYKLCYLTDTEDGQTLGFYWGANDGAAFTNMANRAYMALEKSQASQVRGFSFPDNGQTGISAAENNSVARRREIYTLSGTRLNVQDTQPLPSGIYVVDGKKYVK